MGLQKKTADADAEIDDSISHQSRWFSLQEPAQVHLCTYYFSTSDLRRFLLQMSMQRRLQWTSGLPQFHRVGPHLKLSQEIYSLCLPSRSTDNLIFGSKHDWKIEIVHGPLTVRSLHSNHFYRSVKMTEILKKRCSLGSNNELSF